MHLMASVILVMYFQKYSGTAVGVKNSGSALSAIVFPYLLLHLKEEYGSRGTFLLVGGIMLHLTAVSLLLREPTWTRKRGTTPVLQNQPTVGDSALYSAENIPLKTSVLEDITVLESLVEAAMLFRAPVFYLLLICFVLVDYTQTTVLSTVVDFGQDKGFSLSDAESVIAYAAPTEVIGFVLLPLLADRQYMSRGALTAASFFVLGLVLCLVPECASYGSFTSVVLLVRVFQSCVRTMRIILLVDYFGAEKLPTSWGIAGLACVPFFLLNPSIIGA